MTESVAEPVSVKLERTNEIVTASELREITGHCGVLGEIVQVCGGAYQLEADHLYHFWRDPEWEE